MLASVPPEWHDMAGGDLLFRVYSRADHYPTTWNQFRTYGPMQARFNHHLSPPHTQTRAILYAATQMHTALAEIFQNGRTINTIVSEPWLAGFRLTRAIRLLDLTGSWPTRAGASVALSSGARPRARRWSQAIYDAYPGAEGLWYPSSMYGNRPCVALYERAQPAMPLFPVIDRALADPALLQELDRAATTIGYALVVRPLP